MIHLLTRRQGYFNPRLREGGDSHRIRPRPHTGNFNPRLREGGDLSGCFTRDSLIDFNPRLREGGDGGVDNYVNDSR